MNGNRDQALKNVFKFRKIAFICLYTSLLFSVLGGINLVFGIIGIGFLISFLIINLRYWRCPYCNKGFEIGHSSMDSSNYCPSCGKKLRN